MDIIAENTCEQYVYDEEYIGYFVKYDNDLMEEIREAFWNEPGL